jgi:hypothetical protein
VGPFISHKLSIEPIQLLRAVAIIPYLLFFDFLKFFEEAYYSLMQDK